MGRLPQTRIDDIVEDIHGVQVHDPYRWPEEGDAAAVREWSDAQNAYARSVLDALPGRAAIGARLTQVIDRGGLGASIPRGRYRFFSRRSPGMDQAARYRRGRT